MHPVVAPSRSSQTRSVFARFLVRVSGYGILTDVTRLMTLRTSSRSAALAGVSTTPSSRLAMRRGLVGGSIWENPPGEARFARATWIGVLLRSETEPTV